MTSPAAREWFPMHEKWADIQIVVKCVRYALYTKKGKASSQEQRYFIISGSFDASHVNDIKDGSSRNANLMPKFRKIYAFKKKF
jgi:hypothetical protein